MKNEGIHSPWEGPAIILVDLDAFFAAVEQLDHPGWRGKPLIVGGDANKHGVVSTASYEARKYGIHSAMPSSTAHKLCPEAIWTAGNFSRYREVSKKVMDILFDESPLVQQVSIDEAFVDISPTNHNIEHPVLISQRIQNRIKMLGVTASIGLGTSKTVAKIASDIDKPQGLTAIYPGREKAFLAPLPIRTLSGIGASTEKKLLQHGIETLGDLAEADKDFLVRVFGKNGEVMHVRANGGDNSPIETEDEVKSVSNEMTFAEDLTKQDEVDAALSTIAAKVGRRLRMKGLKGHTLSLKVKYDDRSTRNIQKRLDENTDDNLLFIPLLQKMITQLWKPGIPIRLLGVSISGFDDTDSTQERLFELPDSNEETPVPAIECAQKRSDLLNATDKVRDRFGESALRFGHEIKTSGQTTGSSSKNPADYK